jgi:hypothetical protein
MSIVARFAVLAFPGAVGMLGCGSNTTGGVGSPCGGALGCDDGLVCTADQVCEPLGMSTPGDAGASCNGKGACDE